MKNNPEKTSKLIIPQKGENKTNQELFEDLKGISDEEIMQVGEEIEQSRKDAEKNEYNNKNRSKRDSHPLDDSGEWQQLGDIKYNKKEETINRNGKSFNFNTDQGHKDFVAEILCVMRKDELEKISFVLKEIGQLEHASIIDSVIIPTIPTT